MTEFVAVWVNLQQIILTFLCHSPVLGRKRFVYHNDVNNNKWLQNTFETKSCHDVWFSTASIVEDSLFFIPGPPSIWICSPWRFWDGIWTLSAVHLGNWQYQRCYPFSKIYSFMYFIAGRLVKENYPVPDILHVNMHTGECMFEF